MNTSNFHHVTSKVTPTFEPIESPPDQFGFGDLMKALFGDAGHAIKPCGPDCTCVTGEDRIAGEAPVDDGGDEIKEAASDFASEVDAALAADRVRVSKTMVLADLASLLKTQAETTLLLTQMVDDALISAED